MPKYNDEDLSYRPTFHISKGAMDRDYQLLGKSGKVEYYTNKTVTKVLAGNFSTAEYEGGYKTIAFYVYSDLGLRENPSFDNFPKDHNLLRQVSLVNTVEGFQDQGIGKSMYLLLVSKGYTVLSDTEQYLGGKKLWQSLAKKNRRDSTITIYQGKSKDYLRDSNQDKIVYDGSNIPDKDIWGSHNKTLTLLVLSK